ncbi:MAG: peptide deformylase [Rhodospirillaceae bacterium]|jgi:peptide deformylase|nr:peptide deformylase [Alphaproteobacteria bacterium]MAQ02821.1 peptide deformylase [Rhodospirillaceae bacterium]|tara:strand:+ start:4056 stop:4577 length:522 start_codon:yes stop_codon:yes gene_type:complete
MAILPIIVAPDPRLKGKSAPIDVVSKDIIKLMDDMLETMYAAPGIGLAAPQVGVQKRVIVVDVSMGEEDPNPFQMINPEIVWLSDTLFSYEEGCLSLPEQFADVQRPDKAKIRYKDKSGQETLIDVEGLLSVCVQHEIDHLDGILFVDHISKIKKNVIMRKLKKFKKSSQNNA